MKCQASPGLIDSRFTRVLAMVALMCAMCLPLELGASAQTINQSYDCGTYGAGDFGANDCVSPVATLDPHTDMSPFGPLPGTGAQLIGATAVGLVIVAVGLLLYGRSRRTSRRAPTNLPS